MLKVAKLINFPKELFDAIELYQKETYISSFTGAVFELIRKGLTH